MLEIKFKQLLILKSILSGLFLFIKERCEHRDRMNRSKIIEVSYIITSQLINYTELQNK